MQFGLQHFSGWQGSEVFGDVDAAGVQFQQFDLFLLFAAAQDDAQWRRLARLLLVFGQPAQYWWLAFDYMNFRVCGNVGNRKKGGWFPLKAGWLCSTHAQPCEESETPYLLDPIDDDDVSLIAFDEEGKVIPMPGSSAWEQERVNMNVAVD